MATVAGHADARPILPAAIILIGLLAGLPLALVACSEKPGAPSITSARVPGPPRIVSSIPPIRGIIQPLLAGAIPPYEHTTLVPPGASEHGFEISPEQMAALAKADIVVLVGLGMEPQVEKFLSEHASTTRRVVVLADTVRASLAAADESDHSDHAKDTHDHAAHDDDAHAGHDHDDHDHHHHGADPHIWLDPVLVRTMISECAAALKSVPGTSGEESKRLDAAAAQTLTRVDRIDADYRAAFAGTPTRTIVVAHDAYGYLARRYQLEVIPISGLSAGEPQPGDVQKAAEIVRDRHLTTIFVEPQLSPATAQRIAAATGARTAVLDPLGDGDWFALMERNLKALRAATTPAPAATEPSP